MRVKAIFVAISTAGAIGLLVGASSVRANDIDVNPSTAQSERESRGNQLPWWWNESEVGGSFAYQPIISPIRETPKRVSPKH